MNCSNIPNYSDCIGGNYEEMIRRVKELSKDRPAIADILNSKAHITAISECGKGFYDIGGISYRDPLPNDPSMDWVKRFKFKLEYWFRNKERFIVFN